MSQDQILLTSSDNIPHSEIEQQFGIVDSQIVIGANIFRDVFSSFRDIFGGETKGYKKDLDKMKKAAFSEIKQQAKEQGANAIISLRLDLDEVSGGGKSMFMLNAYGSAVVLKRSILNQQESDNIIDEISAEDLEFFKRKNRIIDKIEEADQVLNEVSLDAISEFELWEHDIALEVLTNSQTADRSLQNNLSEIPIEFIEEFLNDNIHELHVQYWNLILEDLDDRNWFNYDLLQSLLRAENHIKRFRALKLSTLEKKSFSKNEIPKLENLGTFLRDNFDETVESKEVSKMIGSKKVFICSHCLNDTILEEHRNCDCGRNKFGFKKSFITPKRIAKNLLETSEAMKSAFNEYN